MTTTDRKFLKALSLIMASFALLFPSACDRLTDGLGVTGQVEKVAPKPIGSKRLRVTLPNLGTQATLAPITQRQDVTVWQTLDGITLAFRDGVVIQTRGLGNDLMSSDVSENLDMLGGTKVNAYYPHIRSYLDGEDRLVFQGYQCRQLGRQTHQVMVGGRSLPAKQVGETCKSQNHEFSNTYWLDQGGLVIKSRQWVSSNVGYMETEYTVW
ncbi:YjbF family lipoprotein [Roseovarius sp. S4756]|uniref:YjbF family lipoprotein n=1 Tax=Roseovarius maritimus TaxID=3342637 RepID=UPI0037284C87